MKGQKILLALLPLMILFTVVAVFALEPVTANDFKVTWHDCLHGLTEHSCLVNIQNLDPLIARDFNLALLFNSTNYEITKTTATINEWKALPTQVPTYDTVLIPQNCTRIIDNLTNASEQYDCSYNQIFQNGTITQSIVQWKSTKALLTKQNTELKASYGNINVPKFNSNEKYDDLGSIETFNGTKTFKVEWTTPITNTGYGWGSSGLVAFVDSASGEIYHPWWNSTWHHKINFTITGTAVTNGVIKINFGVSFNFAETLANGADIRFVNGSEESELNFFVEVWDKTNTAGTIFVNLSNQCTTDPCYIWMYYNNLGATTASDWSKVLDFYNSTTAGNMPFKFGNNDITASTAWKYDIVDTKSMQITSTKESYANITNGGIIGYAEFVINWTGNSAGTALFSICQNVIGGLDDYLMGTLVARGNLTYGCYTPASDSGVAQGAGIKKFTFKHNGTRIFAYIDGVNVCNKTTPLTTNLKCLKVYRDYTDPDMWFDSVKVWREGASILTSSIGTEQSTDLIAPTVTIITPINTTYNTLNISFTFTAGDETLLDKCWWSKNNGDTNTSLPNCINATLLGTEGSNHLHIYANDSSGNINTTAHVSFTIDFPPQLQIQSPINTSYNINTNLKLNYTAGDSLTNVDTCWYKIDAGSNIIITGCVNATFNVSEGSHTLNMTINDSYGSKNSTLIRFSSDITKPFITIDTPINMTYNNINISINYRVSEPMAWCGYSLNNGANVTLINCNNATFLGAEGSNNIIIFGNDTANNTNTSQTIYFTLDTTGPTVTFNVPPTPTDGIAQPPTINWVNVSITLNENATWCYFEWNKVANYTMIGSLLDWYYTLINIPDGTYYYKTYCNDSYNNIAPSAERTVIILTGGGSGPSGGNPSGGYPTTTTTLSLAQGNETNIFNFEENEGLEKFMTACASLLSSITSSLTTKVTTVNGADITVLHIMVLVICAYVIYKMFWKRKKE